MMLQHCWWQIIVAAIAYFALGAIWFNPKVLGTMWMNSHGIKFDPEKMKEGMAMRMGLSFIQIYLCYALCSKNTQILYLVYNIEFR